MLKIHNNHIYNNRLFNINNGKLNSDVFKLPILIN